MGCGESKSDDDVELRAHSKSLEKQLKDSQNATRNELKILLLGTGESGKSTIAKQMRILYLHGFPDEERRQFIPAIHHNIFSSMKILAFAYFQLQIETADSEEHLEMLREYQKIDAYRTPLTADHARNIAALWKDPAVQAVHEARSEYFLPGCVEYFLDSLERVSHPDFLPTPEDVLRCRVKTTTIIETCFSHEGTPFRMVDVGGQRSERRKWIHCFQDVSAMLYVSAISEYDQRLLEDGSVIRLAESIELFEELINSVWFRNQAIILFLNKVDLFQKKILTTPLTQLFPDFPKSTDAATAIEFLAQQFTRKNRVSGRTIFVHPTTATDTENIRFVFASVKESLLQRVLATSLV